MEWGFQQIKASLIEKGELYLLMRSRGGPATGRCGDTHR